MWKQSNASTSAPWAFLVRLGMLAMLVIGGAKIALSQPRPGGDPANPLSGKGSLPGAIFVYQAQGSPGGCGENCSDWLAAEGRVYWDGYKRIIARLDTEDDSEREKKAISGTVTGNDQHVGFRAMIMKQAIEYNLAGYTRNLPNDVVNFTLQGDAKRSTDGLGSRPQKRGHRNGTGGLSRHEES